MTDYNPDTINKLIGAKVTSYNSITNSPLKEKEKEEFNFKLNPEKEESSASNYYEASKESEQVTEDQKREARLEEAYSFIEDNFEDLYMDVDMQKIAQVQQHAQGLKSGMPKKRFLLSKLNPGGYRKRKRKYLQRQAANFAVQNLSKLGPLGNNPDISRAVAGNASKITGAVVGKGQKFIKNYKGSR